MFMENYRSSGNEVLSSFLIKKKIAMRKLVGCGKFEERASSSERSVCNIYD